MRWILRNRRIFLFLILLLFFLGLSHEISEIESEGDLEIRHFDERILIWISQYRGSNLNLIFRCLTELGATWFLTVLVAGTSLMFGLRRHYRSAAQLILSGLSAAILSYELKQLITRARPDVVPHLAEVWNNSYPSGHSIGAAVIYTSLYLISQNHRQLRDYRIIFLVFASILIFSVALSRVFLGVHFPSDTAGGVSIGVAGALFINSIVNRFWKDTRNY